MITHHLVERGLAFDDAYAAARAIRDRVGGREEVTTAELRDLIDAQMEQMFGPGHLELLPIPVPAVSGLRVIYRGEEQPFSRGLLARSLHGAGVDLDRAYRLVTDLEGQLAADGGRVLASSEIARAVAELLEEAEGAESARRYRLMRRIHRLPHPIAIYIGGASGTGKSKLALELAPLLRIYRVTATDTIRQVMRMVFTPAILPVLHRSSFELAESDSPWDEREQGEGLIAGFEEQATRVCVGIRAVVERAAAENRNVVVEGVHVVPGILPFRDLAGDTYQVVLTLATLDEEAHRARFLHRSFRERRQADHYLEHFAAIRALQEHVLELAEQHDVPLVDTSDADSMAGRALRVLTDLLGRQLPAGTVSTEGDGARTSPVLMLYIDGLADRPVAALGGRTPLEAAATPVLDRLAAEGRTGLADPVAPGVVADTVAGCLALYGQSPVSLRRGSTLR